MNINTKRLFSYQPLTADKAERGKVGIPRVLNMFENYPFWFTFFTELKYEVVLSPTSTRKLYELGIESIPSESECYPAKLAHGHVTWLLKNGVKFIFYPCIPYERNEFPDAVNHYNCPIVTSYAENIKNNVDELNDPSVNFRNPFLAFTSEEILTEGLVSEFKDIPAEEVKAAAHKAWEELDSARKDVQKKGEETLKYMEETGHRGIVLAGRPYHIDPEIHHGIPSLINSYGIAVLTEDSVSHLVPVERPIRVNDQWMYHSRLYAAANFVKTREDLAGKSCRKFRQILLRRQLSKEDPDLTGTFAQLQTVPDYNTAVMDLQQGAVDAIAMDKVVAAYQIEGRGEELTILDDELQAEEYGIGFKLGNTDLRDKVQSNPGRDGVRWKTG